MKKIRFTALFLVLLLALSCGGTFRAVQSDFVQKGYASLQSPSNTHTLFYKQLHSQAAGALLMELAVVNNTSGAVVCTKQLPATNVKWIDNNNFAVQTSGDAAKASEQPQTNWLTVDISNCSEKKSTHIK